MLLKEVFGRDMLSFIAVNSLMFGDINKLLEDKADNAVEFTRKNEKAHFKVLKFKGSAPEEERAFEFPVDMFCNTRKEVAERTSKIIKGKKEM